MIDILAVIPILCICFFSGLILGLFNNAFLSNMREKELLDKILELEERLKKND